MNFKISGIGEEEKNSFKTNSNTNLKELNVNKKEPENTVSEDSQSSIENKVSDNLSTNTISNTVNTDTNMTSDLNTNTANDLNLISQDTNTVGNVSIENQDTNTVENTTDTSNNLAENIDTSNTVSEEAKTLEEENIVSNETAEKPAVDSAVTEDDFIDETAVLEEKVEQTNKAQENLLSDIETKVVADNEISLMNLISDTKIEVNLEYIQGEFLNIEDLYKNIKVQLSGTFINSDLEEIAIGKEEEISVGWKYSKDISLESEYTKFSPFEIGEIKGTIVENKITVKRDILETKYLPLKSTKLEISIPKVNDKLPIDVDIVASKLLATTGEDTGYTSFSKENWKYDDSTGNIVILVSNDKTPGSAKNTYGSDEYVIIYRYEDFVSEENSNLDNVVKVTAEEYSAKENNILSKEINNKQSIKVDVGELVTYSINSTEERINKANVYANYNSEIPMYEAIYTTQVNVNILTNDILEELKIDSSKEYYIADNGVELEAQGIEYKSIKFSYAEIVSILSEGGEIVITNANGDLLYTLNASLISKEEDCIINLNGANGIIIYAKNMSKNGTINFELTKAIKKCNYDKSVFKNITQIESRITAEVKYQELDQRLSLQTIGAKKDFVESYTAAELSINKESLSTIGLNEDVELKIELNNDKETSDLYINPTFEMVFPEYVKSVEVENINLLYENGLQVSDFHTYTENDIVKMRIELQGVQTTFSESSLTNGTNIIVTANIEIDDYTPAKEDQIKLYYYNEGVSNYQSQTKWTINKNIPDRILKQTNGFDVALINYQAPSGLVTINGILNYDGNLSSVISVKQGEMTRQIPINAPSRIATMELLALNNTGNDCTDVVLLGRVPFKENKDVITGDNIGTTADTKMVELIKEDVENKNLVTIYYSTNPNANKNLDDIQNGWTTFVSNASEVKSYLIVVKGKMSAGQVLRYTYDFEIPANLPYESKIMGSFGGFYNNNTEGSVVYESTVADRVGLITETGPKVEAFLSVDIGDGVNVGEARFLKYTLKVENTGSIDAVNIAVDAPRPTNTILYEYDAITTGVGNNNYVIAEGKNNTTWGIDKLQAGESREFEYLVKTSKIKTNEEYKQGKDIFVESKAIVNVENLGIQIESNKVSNKIVSSNLDLQINTFNYDTSGKNTMGSEMDYNIFASNISEKELNNIKVSFKLPKEVEFKEAKVLTLNGSLYDEKTLNFDKNTGEISFVVSHLSVRGSVQLKVATKIIKSSMEKPTCYATFTLADGTVERTTDCEISVLGPILEVTQDSNTSSIKEGDYAEFAIKIENKGNGSTKGLRIKGKVSDYLKQVKAKYTGSSNGRVEVDEQNNIDGRIVDIAAGGSIVLIISGKATNLKEGLKEDKITNQATITADYIDSIDTGIATIILKENPDKESEKPKEDEKVDHVVKPDNNKPDNNKPDDNKPDNNKPDNNKPDDNKPDNNQPSNNQPSNNQPSNNQPSNNQPSNNKPSSNQTSNNQPSNNQPSNNQPSNNQTSNNKPSSNQPSNNQSDTKVNEKIYSISGKAWLDSNQNGRYDNEEEKLSMVKVQLQKDSSMIKATTTDGNGEYEFRELEAGNYNIIFLYNSEKYITTTYKKQDVTEEFNSNALEIEPGNAVTDNLTIVDKNISDINIGLKSKDAFDLKVDKYLNRAVVKTAKGDKEYKFKDESLSKVEIRSKELKDSKVKLEYKIVVENVGLIEGKALKIIDELPKDMIFEEAENNGWYLSKDGKLYNETLKDIIIKPEEKVELKLIATKQMTADNVGFSSNKVVIGETENKQGLKDIADNNISTQEVLITVSTNGTIHAIYGSIILLIIMTVAFKNRDKLNISFNKKYKNNIKTKKIKKTKLYK